MSSSDLDQNNHDVDEWSRILQQPLSQGAVSQTIAFLQGVNWKRHSKDTIDTMMRLLRRSIVFKQTLVTFGTYTGLYRTLRMVPELVVSLLDLINCLAQIRAFAPIMSEDHTDTLQNFSRRYITKLASTPPTRTNAFMICCRESACVTTDGMRVQTRSATTQIHENPPLYQYIAPLTPPSSNRTPNVVSAATTTATTTTTESSTTDTISPMIIAQSEAAANLILRDRHEFLGHLPVVTSTEPIGSASPTHNKPHTIDLRRCTAPHLRPVVRPRTAVVDPTPTKKQSPSTPFVSASSDQPNTTTEEDEEEEENIHTRLREERILLGTPESTTHALDALRIGEASTSSSSSSAAAAATSTVFVSSMPNGSPTTSPRRSATQPPFLSDLHIPTLASSVSAPVSPPHMVVSMSQFSYACSSPEVHIPIQLTYSHELECVQSDVSVAGLWGMQFRLLQSILLVMHHTDPRAQWKPQFDIRAVMLRLRHNHVGQIRAYYAIEHRCRLRPSIDDIFFWQEYEIAPRQEIVFYYIYNCLMLLHREHINLWIRWFGWLQRANYMYFQGFVNWFHARASTISRIAPRLYAAFCDTFAWAQPRPVLYINRFYVTES